MPQRPIKNRWRLSVRLAALLSLCGCAVPSGSHSERKPALARLVMQNLTDRTWEITLAPAGGGALRSERLPPQMARELVLTGGEYAIVQTLCDIDGGVAAARRLVVNFSAGERYRWPLATLSQGRESPLAEVEGQP